MPSGERDDVVSRLRHIERLLDSRVCPGWTAERTPGGHVRVTHPDVPSPIHASGTPSCWRDDAHVVGMARRALRRAMAQRAGKQ